MVSRITSVRWRVWEGDWESCVVAGVAVCICLEQHAHDVWLWEFCGEVEGRVAVCVAGVDVYAHGEEVGDDGRVEVPHSKVERCLAVLVCSRRNVHMRLGKERTHPR